MSEHQNLEKNRIRCEAKIRNREIKLGYQTNVLVNNQSKLLIDLKNLQSVEEFNTFTHVPLTEQNKNMTTKDQESFIGSSKTFLNELQLTRLESKQWEQSEIRWGDEDTESLVWKEDFTKRCEITDFTEFERSETPCLNSEYDCSFNQKILQDNNFDSIQKHEIKSSKNVAYLERTLQYKNVEFINVLVTKNEEKKVLEKKIFDLEFQMFLDKRTSDQTINSIATSLKNAQQLSQTKQIQIKRLEQELKLSQELRQKVEASYELKINQLLSHINTIESNCQEMRLQVQQSNLVIQSLKIEKTDLQNTIKQLQQQKSKYQSISALKQQFTTNLQLTFQNLTLENIQQICQDSIENSQQSIQSQVSYLQNVIKQYEKQLIQNRRKMRQQKKTIINLQVQIQQLQGVSISLDTVNNILSSVNQQMMSMQLSKLNLLYQ